LTSQVYEEKEVQVDDDETVGKSLQSIKIVSLYMKKKQGSLHGVVTKIDFKTYKNINHSDYLSWNIYILEYKNRF
jgi:hypothetical protein